MSKTAARRTSEYRDKSMHSSYGHTAAVPITHERVPRFISRSQNKQDGEILVSPRRFPQCRELTGELSISSGTVILSEDGMRNLEARISKSGSSPARIKDYYENYFGIRSQLSRCRDIFE